MVELYFKELAEAFEKHANPSIAAGAKAYMRDRSEFYGVPSPLRKSILKDFLSKAGYPPYEKLEGLVKYAWSQPQREWQYSAMDITEKSLKKADKNLIDLAEWMITNKSWWDTVDFIAPNIAGALFVKFPEIKTNCIDKWMQSDHLWLQRSCLLHQLKINKTADRTLLFDLCEQLSGHPDFFIRKAIGWALRQYSKAYPEAVMEFVNTHKLSNLSRKEALKVIMKKDNSAEDAGIDRQ